jgi:hypothetical protein
MRLRSRMTKFTDIINEKLANVLTFICENPLVFVSETDVHMLVSRELMKIDELNPEENLYSTDCTIGTSSAGQSQTKYKTMLLHKEYGHKNISNARSDLVILPLENGVSSINDPINLKNKDGWLRPDYIFEFGTEKSAGSAESFASHLLGDLLKVSEASKCGYIIHIHRNYYTSKGERHLKNIEKIENYLSKYKEIINNPALHNKPNWKIATPLDFSKIKILFIVIDIGGEGRQIRGKIRMLKEPYAKADKLKFTKVNLKEIKDSIKNILKLTP